MQKTYAEVAEAALGRSGRAIVNVFLVLSQTGFCVAYVVFIYKNLPLLPLGKVGITLVVLPLQARLCFSSTLQTFVQRRRCAAPDTLCTERMLCT